MSFIHFTTMASVEAPFSYFISFTPISSKPTLSSKPSSLPLCPQISTSIPILSLKFSYLNPLRPAFIHSTGKLGFKLCAAVEEIAVEQAHEEEPDDETNLKKKLFVFNLPWSFTVADVKSLFGECGIVTDVEILKRKDGNNRGYIFVTMASGEEAQAVIDKFDSKELSGRIVKIEFAKRLKKPSPPLAPTAQPQGETRYNLYVSNLAWKVRSTHLREFLSANNFNPVSARVVFDSASGKSGGYGFVSFATKEEAEAAISGLNGKELFERPIRLKFSVRKADVSEKGEGSLEEQPGEEL